MRYFLRNDASANSPEIDITAEEFCGLKAAREILRSAFAIEATYEVIITNYEYFENQLLAETVSGMLRHRLDYSDFFEVRLAVSVRLLSLLSAIRLYRDSLPRNVQYCLPDTPNTLDVVRKLFSREYDGSREYRFMEELRNHAQHRGVPVHWTQQRVRWTSLDEDGVLEYTIGMAALRSSLDEDPKFKSSVLEEAEDKTDLKQTTRCYVESMSNVHTSVREIIAGSVADARGRIEEAHARYAEAVSDGGNRDVLGAYAWEDDEVHSYVPLLLDWDDVRVKLQKRNGRLTNLSKWSVSGRLLDA